MRITHYTKPFHINKILATNELKLEGCNFDLAYQALYFKERANIKLLWFTQSECCYTAKPLLINRETLSYEFVKINQIGFNFDSNEIGAVKWCDWYKPQLIFNKKRKIINELNSLALERGDNPQDYWILKTPISLNKCLSVTVRYPNGNNKNLKLENLYQIKDFYNF